MSGELFPVLTAHCIYCPHKETDLSGTGSSDALERHYWDEHYDHETRAKLRSAGQRPERIGKKP